VEVKKKHFCAGQSCKPEVPEADRFGFRHTEDFGCDTDAKG
jgi:hypothetical protein